MKTLRSKIAALFGISLGCFAATSFAQTTSVWLDLDFNELGDGFASWSSPGITGTPVAGGETLFPTLPADADFDSGLFPSAPTSGYLALAPDASAVIGGLDGTFFGGWASNVTLATMNSPYIAGGFGQPDLSKVSLTAKVRATGLPPEGAVVILQIKGDGDNPNEAALYRRITFEPIFLEGNDWVTIGGTLDTAGLAAGAGTIYNFPTDSAQYTVLMELSGFNQFDSDQYYPYDNPTTLAPGGRKNPGFGFTGGIRVEIDDVQLVVTDPSTTGLIDSTTPDQLLRNGDFASEYAFWTFFEGAYVSSDGWSEDGSLFALIPGWAGSPYAGFMQNAIEFDPANGEFFTASFRANFEANYQADSTIVAFMDGGGVNTFTEIDITDEIAARLGQWHTYEVTFWATPDVLDEMDGSMSFKIQPLGRTVGAESASVLIDNIVLSQTLASEVGPNLAVHLAGASRNNGETATLNSAAIDETTRYSLRLQNIGAEDLTITDIALAGTDFGLDGFALPVTLGPGETSAGAITASPAGLGPLSGALTVSSNDADAEDQTWTVNLAANTIKLHEVFDGTATLEELGWFIYASTDSLRSASIFTQENGAMVLNVDSSGDIYPWAYIVSKPFASPGSIDLASSSLEIALRAEGVFSGLTQNKVQVRLESLNAAGTVTGTIELGEPIDETTAGAVAGSDEYFTPDGITDRVAILLPEGGGTTVAGGILGATGVNTNFDPDAPAFRLVVHMTDFDFDLDAANIVEIDSIDLSLGTRAFAIANGGFESDAADPGTANPPISWQQFPAEGVSKNIVTEGDAIYNASLLDLDPELTFVSHAGAKALKVYGQNYYADGVWQGPSQTGTVYQSFTTATTGSLAPGAVIHARAMAKIYSIDPLTGGSSFRFGFQYLDAANAEIGRDVTTLDSTARLDTWLALVANGTVPEGAARVQLISEFVQNAATDGGAVYLDEASVGFGFIEPEVMVGDAQYELVWSDEFDGSALREGSWTPEFGNGVNGWGNDELQNYTDDPENLRVEDGVLVIEAHKDGDAWTSARIKTEGKRTFQYGKIEFRAKLPSGVGPWPAAWMLGDNFSEVGWPASGEIDVLEWAGTRPNVVGHATHSPAHHGANAMADSAPIANPATTFNTYAVVWEPGQVTFSVNGEETASWSTVEEGDPFEHEFFLLLNLAIGGNYLDFQVDPDLTTARYEIDYVRVYQAVEEAPLAGYQQYLESRGLASDLAFDADADGDGVAEGLRYAFGASSPRRGSQAASIERSDDALIYTFDFRADPELEITPEVSTNLINWATAPDFTLSDGTGAAEGFARTVLTVSGLSDDRHFLRLRIHH